ncbi:MAG TPA: hypothetical protein VMG60_01390 [Burkholderiaceae bacterium]|nr:hypothetical protein [Burkholderiaceae bacterium]
MTVVEELVVEPMSPETQDAAAMHSPFALMHPDAARQIVARAAALDLPSRRCSPLSNPRLGGSPMDDEAGGDLA